MASNSDNLSKVRKATHAGSWYSDSARELSRQLDCWLRNAGEIIGPARAIIAPHAGYTFCGETAAYAFKQVDSHPIKRIFVLGPSHVVCLSGCAISGCFQYQTPLYDINIDQNVTNALRETGLFQTMDMKSEETEHSIEMQLPFIAKIMESKNPNSWSLVPILVGSLSLSKQSTYGKIFAKYLADPANLFVISSDFCHWGHRFHFSPYDAGSRLEIFEQIEQLDKEVSYSEARNAMLIAHSKAAEHFRRMNNHWGEVKFLRYSQSNRCRTTADSSVSYAAAALFIRPK